MEGKEYTDWVNFGIRVKNARNSLGLTAEKLGELTNRSENFIQRVENGTKCSIHTIHQISKALNVKVDVLLYGDDVELKEYKDKEIINNLVNNCNEDQLKVIKDILVAICPNFDKFEKDV